MSIEVSVPSRGTGKINEEAETGAEKEEEKFPSPLGEQGKSTIVAEQTKIAGRPPGFRPLSGNRENQLKERCIKWAISTSLMGFRPLSGNRENQHRRVDPLPVRFIDGFPSPLGEQGKSTRPILVGIHMGAGGGKFPSPLGEQGKSTKKGTVMTEMQKLFVSVPSRGTGKINTK